MPEAVIQISTDAASAAAEPWDSSRLIAVLSPLSKEAQWSEQQLKSDLTTPKTSDIDVTMTLRNTVPRWIYSFQVKNEASGITKPELNANWFCERELFFTQGNYKRTENIVRTLLEYRARYLLPADSQDILDWDAWIKTPPKRPSGKIRVKLKYTGRSKPIPIDCPW